MRETRCALLALACVCAPAAAAVVPVEQVRADFIEAWKAAASDRVPGDSAALRQYVLYPYLRAQRLRHALARLVAPRRDAALEARVRALLAAHDDEPVVRELRRDWLNYLGQRGLWREFGADAPAQLPDTALQCHALSVRIASGDLDGARDAALALWLQRERPAACEPVFRWLDRPERLSDAEVERYGLFAARERLPMPAVLTDLPPERRAVVLFWDRLLASPERGLKHFADGENLLAAERLLPPRPADVADALIEAFTRVARADSKRARPLYEVLEDHDAFSDVQRAQLLRAYALALAYDHDEEALRRFRKLPEAALDPLSREWRVRVALWHRDWRHALQWLEAMPEPQKSEPRWRYWRARVHEHRGNAALARPLYELAATDREYYAFLAAERLQRRPDLRPVALPVDAAVERALVGNPAMERARELFLTDLHEQAGVEFRLALRDLPAAARAQGARVAAGWGWHEAAILLLSEVQLWDDLWLRFPLPYDAQIDAAARDTGLPADWLYAVLRTESLYNPRAVSRADALGLLQLRLTTARQTAQRAKLPLPSREDLLRPAANVVLGAHYLRELRDRFGGVFVLMLAAYNAGPQKIPGWLPESEVPGDVWVENISYNETRTYIQRALSSLVMISWRRSGEPAKLLPLLPGIKPKGDD